MLDRQNKGGGERIMDIKRILAACDHTLLSQDATEKDILNLCDDAIKYGTASVCIPPCYVKAAKDYVGEKMKICTVIGFPLGYQKTSLKVMETKEAACTGLMKAAMRRKRLGVSLGRLIMEMSR